MARKKNVVAFRAVVSGADLKRALEERKSAAIRRDDDIATVRRLLSDDRLACIEIGGCPREVDNAIAAFERLVVWMLRE